MKLKLGRYQFLTRIPTISLSMAKVRHFGTRFVATSTQRFLPLNFFRKYFAQSEIMLTFADENKLTLNIDNMEKTFIPEDNSVSSIKIREQIIRDFYREWKERNPSQRKFNLSLKEYINIRMVSIIETSEHAAKNYLSTLAVLQLDAILIGAKKKSVKKPKEGNKNQKPFEKMLIMEYELTGIGIVKMTVGVRRRTHEKVQYCITAIDSIEKRHL